MRVLWLSPWMRTLARVHGEMLRAAGDEVLLVTSDQHPEKVTAREWEVVLDPRVKAPSTWPGFARAARTVRGFDADVVVTELVRDPRWIGLAGARPRIDVVHDDRPHGADEARPRLEAAVFDRWHRSARATLCFSEYVAQALPSDIPTPMVVGLSSDVADAEFDGGVAGADERRDFVMIGRLNSYKNLDVVLAAWDAHVRSSSYRGDVLRLFGSAGDPLPALPPTVWWNGGAYSHAELLPTLRRAKGSLAHYRVATQSGVQVLSMQAGVAPVVSTEGALPEFAPPGVAPVAVDDVTGLAELFGLLADPESAALHGMSARKHYDANFAPEVVGARLREVLTTVVAQPR